MSRFDDLLMAFLDSPWNVVLAAVGLLAVLLALLYLDQVLFYARFISKSLRRNVLRSALTSVATMVLVLVVTMVWSVLFLLDLVTSEKTRDFKAIITERWQIPSQMPFTYAATLAEGAARKEGNVKPSDSMTWTFIGGTLDPNKRTRENIVFFFGMEPGKMMRAERDAGGKIKRDANGRLIYNSMMDGMDELTDEEIDQLDQACREMEKDHRKVVLGKERLAAINKKVGERFKLTSINYFGIDLEVEIIAEFPEGRYNQSALMNHTYIREAMEAYKRKNGKPHPMAEKALNLVWLRVPDSEAFRQVADQIMSSPLYTTPAVKCETASSGVSSFLDAYRDLLWACRWLFVPAILATLTLVIANAISISVRERRTEMAVLKVLGFSPTRVQVIVLGEAVLLGAVSGFLTALATYLFINHYLGGLKFPIAFFPAFKIPLNALLWGVAIGAGTGLVGAFMPAWSARSIKVAEVFSKIT
ncbi:MAG: ABC transporter permease [Gemmataceae bacterium]